MQAINGQLYNLLTSLIESPTCYVWAQVPAIDMSSGSPVIQYGYLGSQKILNNITSMTLNRALDIGSNSIDFTIDNTKGEYSSLDTVQKYSKYFQTGLADLTYQAFIGMTNEGGETILPVGVYLSNSVSQDVEGMYGSNALTFGGLDQFSLFQGDIYTSFPPRLYGNQGASYSGTPNTLPNFSGSYFNPNYLLTCPAGTTNSGNNWNTTWVCDAVNWMQDETTSVLWASNFIQPNVYITFYNNGSVPVTPGVKFTVGSFQYLVNYDPVAGQVFAVQYTLPGAGGTPTGFGIPVTTNISGNPVLNVVSVDATPLSMAPELALYHLFVDYGGWNPTFLKFDCTGIQIPVVEVGREVSMAQAASDILNMIAPRGQRWRLWIDEIGYIRLTEGATDHVPVKYLTDTRDLLKCNFQTDINNLHNVVRATGTSINNQPITAIAYDVLSINTYSQQPTYDVPSQYLNILMGMDPGAAMSYANGLVSSFLFQYSRPEVTAQIQIMPDITLQVGDLINITESSSGTASNFIVSQIGDNIQEATGGAGGETWTETLYVKKMVYSQDMNFGIQANIGAPSPNNSNTIQAASGFIQSVSFQTSFDSSPVFVVQGGQPVYDNSLNPVVYNWKQAVPLTISIQIAPPTVSGYNGTIWMWRWMYIGADAYTRQYTNYPNTYTTQPVTGNGTMIGAPDLGSGTLTSPGPWVKDIWGYLNNTGGVSESTYPYDVRANTEPQISVPGTLQYITPTARRFWRPLLICPNWYDADGIQGYTYNTSYSGPSQPPYNMQIVGPSFTFTDVWNGGVGPMLNFDPVVSNSVLNQTAPFYGMLRIAQNNYFNNTSVNFKGQQIYGNDPVTGLPGAGSVYLGTSSSIEFGVDFGYIEYNNNNWESNGQIIGLNNFLTDSEYNYISGAHQQWTLTNFTVSPGNAGFNNLVTAVGVNTTATAVGPQINTANNTGDPNHAHNPLTTGTVVTFSVFINAQVTSGSNIKAFVKNDAGTTVATLTQPAGTSSQLSTTFTVQSSENYYVVHYDTGTFVAGAGNQLKYSKAILSPGSTGTLTYIPSTQVNSNLFYGITNKTTPCFLQILTATDFGTMELKTITFNLQM